MEAVQLCNSVERSIFNHLVCPSEGPQLWVRCFLSWLEDELDCASAPPSVSTQGLSGMCAEGAVETASAAALEARNMSLSYVWRAVDLMLLACCERISHTANIMDTCLTT